MEQDRLVSSSDSWHRGALLALALLLAACAAELENPARFVDGGADRDAAAAGGDCPEGTDVETELLAERCAGSVCHSAGESAAAGLDLVSPGVAERLVGVASTSEACGGAVLVVAGDPDASLLVDKLLPSPSCGGTMPLGQTPFTDSEITCVRDWIAGMSAEAP